MDELVEGFTNLQLEEEKGPQIVKISGAIYTRTTFPIILLAARRYLRLNPVEVKKTGGDGRIDSSSHENTIIKRLRTGFGDRLTVSKNRHWHDITLQDDKFGRIPINIKSTTTASSDNVGNMALCLYAYTDYKMDLDKQYNNGLASETLIKYLDDEKFNTSGRDYYFLVINKTDPTDVIVNSMLGLTKLTSNNNNLPFQVKWKHNRQYARHTPKSMAKKFIRCVKTPKPTWQHKFMCSISDVL